MRIEENVINHKGIIELNGENMNNWTDEQASKIILKTTSTPKSVKQITEETHLSMSTIYRKIKKLQELRVLEASGSINENGKKYFLYKRKVDPQEFRNNERFIEIIDMIQKNPGIGFSEISRQTGLANGVLFYYLYKMEKNGTICIQRGKRRTWLFPRSVGEEEIGILINLRKETAGKILYFLIDKRRATFKEILAETGKSKPTVSLTLSQLIEKEIVKRNPGFTVTYGLKDYENTLKIATKVKPELKDRLVDRFADTFSYF